MPLYREVMEALPEWFCEQELVVLDCELTGPDPTEPNRDRITELAWVILQGGKPRYDAMYWEQFNPGKPQNEYARTHTGLIDSELAKYPPISSRITDISRYLFFHNIAGHNVGMDLGFLSLDCNEAGLPALDHVLIDTVELAREVGGRGTPLSLTELIRDFDIEPPDHPRIAELHPHRALWDAVMTAELLRTLVVLGHERNIFRSWPEFRLVADPNKKGLPESQIVDDLDGPQLRKFL